MKTHNMLISFFLLISFAANSQQTEDYLKTIQKEGQEPVSFVKEKIASYDLIIFDDAIHSAVEPFDFYIDFLEKNPSDIDYIFMEAVPISAQPYLDSFLTHKVKDTTILTNVFQMDLGYGWPYETYLTLYSKVWDINQKLAANERIQIIGTDQPFHWELLKTIEDFNMAQQSMIARDYFMYKIIADKMDHFNSGKKGFFLTNTRHAYKGIKNSNGFFHWNAGTFFYQWHPDKTYAVRIHNMVLKVESLRKENEGSTAEGLEKVNFEWIRPDNGKWDEAFALNKNHPVAVPFKNNPFGNFPFTGNQMQDAEAGQTMYNAYDALIFLKPLQETKFSAHTKFYYTPEFKKELVHRVKVLYGHDLDAFLQRNKVKTIEEYVERLSAYVPERPNPLVK